MVTRSIEDYEQHKKDIYKVISDRLSSKHADKFIERYSDCYDSFGRSYIDYRLAVNLMSDYNHVKRIGTRMFAAVGLGGTGKSTLMKNILYWLDNKFTHKDVSMDVLSFIKSIDRKPKRESLRAVMLDEPETEIAATSTQGKKLRNIVGKWRQQGLFVGLCATDLADIPPYLFKKIEVLFFLPYWGTCFMVRNLPKKRSYAVQQIRMWYIQGQKGYNVFYQLKKMKVKGVIRYKTMSKSPLDVMDGEIYLDKKQKDYEKDLKKCIEMLDPKSQTKQKKDWKESITTRARIKVLHDLDPSQSSYQIAAKLGCTRAYVGKIRTGWPRTRLLNENKKIEVNV